MDGAVYATKTVEYGTTFAELAEAQLFLRMSAVSVVTEDGEQSFEDMANTPIASDYSVISRKLTLNESALKVLQKYPWIIFAGGVLAVIVGIISVVIYSKQTAPAKRKKR